ncbi:hypothetical protein E4U58_005818 [Claviceps cyperi]|nr:hypothetical protein E4U58_005818 [Claviceps cyperi]
MASEHLDNRDTGLTGSPASRAVRAIQAPSIEVGGHSDDNCDISSVEGDDGTTSLASSILSAQADERGHRHAAFRDVRYPMPIDEIEQNREDLKHSDDAYRKQAVPLSDWKPPANDFGYWHGYWHLGSRRDVDLAHFRFTIVILKNTSQVLGHAFESLRPGGWIELQEFLPTVLCDDGTMPGDDPVKVLYEKIERLFERFGLKVALPPKLEPYLREAGFENICCYIMKVPIRSWAKDNTMRIIGLYQKLSVREVMPSLSGRPFQALGMSEAEIEVTIAMARKGLEDPNVHRYFNYYFWYVQKPASSVGDGADFQPPGVFTEDGHLAPGAMELNESEYERSKSTLERGWLEWFLSYSFYSHNFSVKNKRASLSDVHATTTSAGKVAKDHMGMHVAVNFKTQEHLDRQRHVTCHGYVRSSRLLEFIEAPYAPEKA